LWWCFKKIFSFIIKNKTILQKYFIAGSKTKTAPMWARSEIKLLKKE